MTSDYLKAHFKGSTYLEGSGSFDHSIVSAMWTLGGNQELFGYLSPGFGRSWN